MTSHYCETCEKFVTNKWSIIGNKHVGCPKANKGGKMSIKVKFVQSITTLQVFTLPGGDKVIATKSPSAWGW